MSISEGLKEKIEGVAGENGFWRNSTRGGFFSAAEDLIAHGYSEDEAVEFLEGMYSDVSGEYGN